MQIITQHNKQSLNSCIGTIYRLRKTRKSLKNRQNYVDNNHTCRVRSKRSESRDTRSVLKMAKLYQWAPFGDIHYQPSNKTLAFFNRLKISEITAQLLLKLINYCLQKNNFTPVKI